jgi:hypothetical protein
VEAMAARYGGSPAEKSGARRTPAAGNHGRR